MKRDMGVSRAVIIITLLLSFPAAIRAQHRAWEYSTSPSLKGNHEVAGGYGIGEDFTVFKPVVVSSLGVFDDGGDGVKGQAALVVHLYASNPDRARKNNSGVLLETVMFDAADSGQLIGGFRYKKLLRPVTLLPGQYTITADGFDRQNRVYKEPKASIWNRLAFKVAMNDNAGAIRFDGCNQYHIGYFLRKRTRTAKDITAIEHRPDRYAAVSFIFSPTEPPPSPFSLDYTILTAGINSFPVDDPTNRSLPYDTHYGSISILGPGAFPVLVEPSGNRLIFEAAGSSSEGGRCVLFAHEQWGRSSGDARGQLFENAIHWASRKAEASDIVVGLSGNMDSAHFSGRGYQIQPLDTEGKNLFACDVLVLDFSAAYSGEFIDQLSAFVAAGGNLVVTYAPWRHVKGRIQAAFLRVNELLEPFGMAYRSSMSQPRDLSFANIQPNPYPPGLFSAFQAADLLFQDRKGKIQLDSLQRAIALNTVAYAADGQPDLMAQLAAVYTGSTNNALGALTGNLGSFAEVLTLKGVDANTNVQGAWAWDGEDLLSEDSRGNVEFDFNVPANNLYRIQIYGSESDKQLDDAEADLCISIDGIPLGQYGFDAPYGSGALSALFTTQSEYEGVHKTSDHVQVLTPFLKAGPHKLRIFWNNHNIWARLRLQSIRIQGASGADSNNDGIVDWVRGFVESQSGLDQTGEMLTSYISPACVEGRDPFPVLMTANVSGNEAGNPNLKPLPSPDQRWHVNVPLASSGASTLQLSYQNGAKSELRQIQWLPVNVLTGGKFVVRDGDSLLLTAQPELVSGNDGATIELTVGTEQFTLKPSAAKPYRFTGSGTVTVKGTYTAGGVSQSGTVTVEIVAQKFVADPDCHVGEERVWSISLPAQVVLEADQQLTVGQLLNGESQTTLMTDQSEPRYVITRLGAGGPILNSWTVRGFDFWEGMDTYLRVTRDYPDGTRLMEMQMVMNPALPDITVQMDILVGGVVFDDGTVSKKFTGADFDELGTCLVRFLHAPTSESAVCHSIKLLQDDVVVGRIW